MLHCIAALALQASPAVAAPPAPPQPGIVVPPPVTALAVPTDWASLPPLPYREEPQVTPAMLGFVRGELRSGRCRPAKGSYARGTLTLEVAVLVGSGGFIRRVVPRAIDCITVEQYGAGLVASFARGNLRQRASGAGDAWHHATLSFGPPPPAARTR